jgi:hypothetical protein
MTQLYSFKKRGKWGCINQVGEIVFPAKFIGTSVETNGTEVAALTKNKHYMYQFNGKQIEKTLEVDYPWYCSSLSSDCFRLQNYKEDKLRIIVKTSGQSLDRGVIKTISGNFLSGALCCPAKHVSEKWGYINDSGDWIVDPVFIGYDIFSNNGFAARIDENHYGYFNVKGELVADPMPGAQYRTFRDGRGVVVKERKYNFFDENFDLISPIWFDMAYDFSEGFATVEIYGKGFNFINVNGEMIFNEFFTDAKSFTCGWALVSLGGPIDMEYAPQIAPISRFYIDKEGNKMFIQHKQLFLQEMFERGMARFYTGDYDQFDLSTNPLGYIDTKGEIIWKPTK